METNAPELPQSPGKASEINSYEELLKETEQMLNFGTWSLDIATGELKWSDEMYALIGHKKASVTGPITAEFYIQRIARDDRESFSKALKESIAGNGKFEHIYTVKGASKDIVVISKGKMVPGPDGKPAKLIGITKDITKERDYEQSLQDKVKELDRSNKELEEFAYIASHDLQEPLRKITSFSERLKEKLGDSIGSDSQLYLDRMLAATDNMRLLIDNLLEFSRTNRYSKPFEKVDLNSILAEVRADLELKTEETDAVIHSDQLPVLEGISSQIRQLFNNLLNNAIKFRRPDQPPYIQISSSQATKQEKERYQLRSNKTFYVIRVKDNGIGFEQEYALKIFQIFQRLHGKAEYPGSGIGLSICKKIVENHKGIIFAEGSLEAGSEFTFILPDIQT